MKKWHKYTLMGLAFIFIPGSSLIALGYSIKAFLNKRKDDGNDSKSDLDSDECDNSESPGL